MTGPNEYEQRFIVENEDLLKMLVERARHYQDEGDRDMMLLMAACLSGTAQVLVEMVTKDGVIIKEEGLTLKDCLKKH